jgi:hypothetical protein
MSSAPGVTSPTEPEPPASRDPAGRFWPKWFSFRRFGEAIQQLLALNNSVQSLKSDNERIRAEIADLQRIQAAQAKQIELLIRFVQTAINERVDLKAENTVYRVLSGLQRLPKPDENGEP